MRRGWIALRTVLGSVGVAIRARPGIFLGVALAVLLLNLFLPPIVLALARKPWDYFAFNPWLRQLPAWLASPEATWGRKLSFLSDVALFWFIASSPYDAPEWGFSVGVRDLARWGLMALLFGAYFALWVYARGRMAEGRRLWSRGGRAGVLGAALSTVGLSTAPCSVAGCGAPVLPVLGLAFQGLTSGALAGLAALSRVATALVLVGVSLAVLALAWLVSRDTAEAAGRPGARFEGTSAEAVRSG